jgi:hypothetical protein
LPRTAAAAAAIIFFALLVLPPLIAHYAPIRAIAIFSAFYRSGALVFGGGHVVLALLENAVVTPGWVTQQSFSGGIWRGAGAVRTAVLLCHLSRYVRGPDQDQEQAGGAT